MINWSDSEVMMSMQHRQQMARLTVEAQDLVDQKNGDINSLRRKLAKARDAVDLERRMRLSAEFQNAALRKEIARLNALLDEPLD